MGDVLERLDKAEARDKARSLQEPGSPVGNSVGMSPEVLERLLAMESCTSALLSDEAQDERFKKAPTG